MSKQKEIHLSPKWSLNQALKYKIYRKDHFSYLERQRYPIENSYEIHLNVLELNEGGIEIEAHYPRGYLYLLTSFQPFSSLIGKEDLFQSQEGNTFKYVVDADGIFIKIKGLKSIKKTFKSIIAKVRKSDLKKKAKKKIISDLSYFLKSKKEIKNYLSRDIELIHNLYGTVIPLNHFHDNGTTIDQDKLDKEINKLKGKEYDFFKNLDYNYRDLAFINVYPQGKELIVDEISGLNLISVALEDRHDLTEIQKDYLNNEFKIEEYNNITLHQKTSKFSLKKRRLNAYIHHRRTVSEKMQKIAAVSIQLIKRKKK